MTEVSNRVERKAELYLTSGKLDVREVDHEEGTALVYVTGSQDGDPYHVHYRGTWVCDCPARTHTCAHVVACSLIIHIETKDQPKVAGGNVSIEEFLNTLTEGGAQ